MTGDHVNVIQNFLIIKAPIKSRLVFNVFYLIKSPKIIEAHGKKNTKIPNPPLHWFYLQYISECWREFLIFVSSFPSIVCSL